MSTLMYGPDYLKGLAEADSKERARKAQQKEKEKLQARANIARQLKESDVLKALDYYIKTNYENAQERLFDPSKRRPGENTESLRVETLVHKQYVELFDVWQKEGETAMRRLMEKEGE